MSELFLSIVNMSISASWIVLAVLLLRLPLKKAPKWIAVLLWAVVALRLVCPVTVESVLSLIPSPQTVPSAIMTDTVPQIYSGSTTMNHIVNPILSDVFSPNPGDSVNPLQIWIPVASAVWGIGILGFFAYGTLSYIRLRRKLCTAVRLRDNIYQSECVVSPFVLGVLRPKIYLPFSLSDEELSHVIAHEEAHLHRKDHWWKPLGFAILALHWFNPLMWLSYVLLCRDIELACDEKVVKDLSLEERADYSQALLHCSVGRKMIAFCPLAFGEVGVKDRIKSVLSYKKPAFWIILVALILSSVLAVCFLTNPRSSQLGTLENLEFISLNTEDTSCVWVSDGFSYERVGPISEDLLRDLANIKTSKEEISANRSEDRDKSHTIVLQTLAQEYASGSLRSAVSYLEGLYIHFNSDFTSVWINNGVKPTLTYKVIEPQRAKEVYERMDNYFDSGPLQTIHGNLKTYYQNTDGTWQCEGYQYKYRLEITGRQPLAETDTTYVYLSNLESIPFEQAMWASGLSSNLTQYFSYEEAMLVEILTVPTAENTVFKKAENGNLISPSGVEYRFLANEGILNYIGELEYVGDVEVKSSDTTSPYKTGIFALKGNDNVLIWWPEDSEWYAIYRKASLPPFQFTIDNCTRLEFLHFSELFLNSEDHIACNRGIVGQTKAQEFLFKVRLFEDPRDAGLYDLVRKPNGFLENCYLYGWLCGFFEEDPNLVVKMQVQSFNDLAYSIEIDRNEHVLANEFLQYLQSVSCPSELYTNEAPTECQANVQIFQNDDRTYSYTVSDLKGNILYRQENAVRKPKVWEVSSDVFGLVTQTGTGLSTNWAVFCDVERGRVSETFYYVLNAQGDYVVYADRKEEKYFVVVQNMFDKSAYCKTYELENVSPVAADFVLECEFDGDGNATVTYLVGKKYTRTKLTINIP